MKRRRERILTPREAVAEQRVLAARIVRTGRPCVATVLGVDTSIREGHVHAAVCLYSFPGRIGLAEAVRLVLACTRGRRLPEPIRAADRLAGTESAFPSETARRLRT